MKISARHQIDSQIQTKKKDIKAETEPDMVAALQPEVMSSYINIPLKKNKKDLLVAENDDMSIIVIKTILEKHNFTFELATTESEAIFALEKSTFHIVLTGINDSEMLWEGLIKKIWEENGDVPKTFLLALTNRITEQNVAEYLNNNFDKILLKPYKETDLIKMIRKFKKLIPKRNSPLNYQSFNLDQLKRISNNNEAFIKNMLDKFIESAIECSESMKSAISLNDLINLKKAAHKALPSYSVLGLKDLAEQLNFIERNASTDQEKDELLKKLSSFDKGNQAIIKEIKKYLENS
ncbi:MAG: response regulator [Bacteroidetes bacterium]|jgi:CheY-like chemotaxis protein/HPt (histidine-containing phosphotransfer) domain-containing protein|nr:response regulator [Bacteroidota bacterium]MDF2452887.1 response regulator [Bacteroidota bacterium]